MIELRHGDVLVRCYAETPCRTLPFFFLVEKRTCSFYEPLGPRQGEMAARTRALEAAFRAPPAARGAPLRELSSRLRRLTDALPLLAKHSSGLALPREDREGVE